MHDPAAGDSVGGPLPSKALLVWAPLGEYLLRAESEYLMAVHNRRPPQHWAILTGHLAHDALSVHGIHYGRNDRERNDPISLWFGGTYTDVRRGYWCEGQDLLRIQRRADTLGEDILGSIHLHTDSCNTMDRDFYPDEMRVIPPLVPHPLARDGCLWTHSTGPFLVSERPSPMDDEMFRATGWPLSIIVFAEQGDSGVRFRVAAWTPDNDLCRQIPVEIIAPTTSDARFANLLLTPLLDSPQPVGEPALDAVALATVAGRR